ncbi:hypothetical protein YC2023_036909 [Brassica napus]
MESSLREEMAMEFVGCPSSSLLFVLQYQNSNLFLRPFILINSFSVEVSWAPRSRVLLLTPSRTCLDAAASLSPPLRLRLLRLCLLLCVTQESIDFSDKVGIECESKPEKRIQLGDLKTDRCSSTIKVGLLKTVKRKITYSYFYHYALMDIEDGKMTGMTDVVKIVYVRTSLTTGCVGVECTI